jgi:hypothetical protein
VMKVFEVAVSLDEICLGWVRVAFSNF